MENLNLVELLRDCPKGMELDCTMFDNVTFVRVDNKREQFPIEIAVGGMRSKYLTKEGCFHDNTLIPEAKCVIFPKGKTTWEGFQRPFGDGDILAIGDTIYIYNGIEELSPFPTHHAYVIADKTGFFTINTSTKKYGTRFATEEEKQKLFDAIKANGYRWNEETKTLKKLPKFKVGDFTGDQVAIGFTHQDDYELVPNKFDITTLKPFESRVLVRDYINREWIPTFWGKHLEDDSNCRYLTTNGCYRYCIPYEHNEHLLGTTNDCDDFYKTWENNNQTMIL